MSAVETIRDIPVIVEHRRGCKGSDYEPMDFDDDDYYSGFPFDNSGRRTRDPLEDIAQRHPEFAQHLQGFPRRSQRTGGDQDQDEFLRRRYERPFASGRFERFGFPFDRDDFEREPQRYYEAYPEYFENFHNQQTPPPSSSQQTPQGYQQHPPRFSQEYQPQKSPPQEQQQSPPQYQTQASQSVSQGTQTEEDKPGEEAPVEPQTDVGTQEQKSEGAQTRGRPIQQSNTCDLGQYQPQDEALNEREQRSMSAPPENKRFSSSVNIPMGGVQQDNNGAPSGGGVKSQASSGSTERVIPIHVEGRDDPVIPKQFSGAPPSQQQQPQPERIFSESPRPQPETIFGRRPEHFTQFVHRDPHRFPSDWPHSFGGFPEEEFGFRQESPNRFAGGRPQQQQQQQQHQPQQQQQHQHHPQQQQQPHRQEAASQAQAQKPQEAEPPKPQQQPPKQPLGPIEQIQAIQKDVSALLRQVEAFSGAPKDKNYIYIDEMLTRNLLKLDNVDTQGQDSIRSARKEAIKCIEKAISLLEAKAAANVASKEEKMEVEQTETAKNEENASSQETMEMSPAASQGENIAASVPLEEGSNKSAAEETGSKSGEAMESSQEQAVEKKEEGGVSEPSESAAQAVEEDTAAKQGDAAVAKTETKEGEKKEKKKIKKKVNKEDKDKKQ